MLSDVAAIIDSLAETLAGRLALDGWTVDVVEGDDAILFGPGTDGDPTAQEWADLLDTIHYEIVTSPRGRVTRRYTGGQSH